MYRVSCCSYNCFYHKLVTLDCCSNIVSVVMMAGVILANCSAASAHTHICKCTYKQTTMSAYDATQNRLHKLQSIWVLASADSGPSSRRPSKSPHPSLSNTSHSPSPAAAAATAGDAAGRAAAELAQFQNRRFGDDVDPDAPAAMKDSPSGSDDEEAGQRNVFCIEQLALTEILAKCVQN